MEENNAPLMPVIPPFARKVLFSVGEALPGEKKKGNLLSTDFLPLLVQQSLVLLSRNLHRKIIIVLVQNMKDEFGGLRSAWGGKGTALRRRVVQWHSRFEAESTRLIEST